MYLDVYASRCIYLEVCISRCMSRYIYF